MVVAPSRRVAVASSAVSARDTSGAGAERSWTTVPGLGEVMVTEERTTGRPKPARMPMPGENSGNCWRYSSVFHTVPGSPSATRNSVPGLSWLPDTTNSRTLAGVTGRGGGAVVVVVVGGGVVVVVVGAGGRVVDGVAAGGVGPPHEPAHWVGER